MSQTEVNIVPENIRANLAKCTKHINLTCLECGYTGLIGVVRSETKRYYWAFIPVALAGLWDIAVAIWAMRQPFVMLNGGLNSPMSLTLPLWVWIACIVFLFIFGGSTKDFYLCPNCEKELEKK